MAAGRVPHALAAALPRGLRPRLGAALKCLCHLYPGCRQRKDSRLRFDKAFSWKGSTRRGSGPERGRCWLPGADMGRIAGAGVLQESPALLCLRGSLSRLWDLCWENQACESCGSCRGRSGFAHDELWEHLAFDSSRSLPPNSSEWHLR